MALTAIGKLEEFDPGADRFMHTVKERLELYMLASDVQADKKRAVLLINEYWCASIQNTEKPCSFTEAV